MRRNYVLITTALLLLLSTFFPRVSANAVPRHVVIYSDVAPTIDGYLGAEWNDTTNYKVNLTGPENIETWIYFKHDGTNIHIGLLVWKYGSLSLSQFAVIFDEGDDGSHGSGTRDYTLTPYQEDSKKCQSGPTLGDGWYDDGQWVSKNVEIDFQANCVYETDHSTSPDEIEYWEGESWVDDHWECEFAIPFIGNDAGTQDVSDLNCTVTDTLGLKIQWFTQPGANNYFYPPEGLYQVNTYADLDFQPLPSIESCNITEAKKDTFDLGETVYVNGDNYSPSTSYDLYIVSDVPIWTDGMTIPSRIPDTQTTISSDIMGNISPTAVWSDPQTIGEYDIVVDINGNGFYDINIDALDNNDIMVTAGFVIPEFSSTLLFLTLVTIAGFFTYMKKKSLT